MIYNKSLISKIFLGFIYLFSPFFSLSICPLIKAFFTGIAGEETILLCSILIGFLCFFILGFVIDRIIGIIHIVIMIFTGLLAYHSYPVEPPVPTVIMLAHHVPRYVILAHLIGLFCYIIFCGYIKFNKKKELS